MEKYKPGFLGKVIPADNPSKLTDFVTKKYDSFSKIYDACKDQSDKITDVKPIDIGDDSSLSIKLSTDKEVVEQIKEKTKDDTSVTVNYDVITVKD